MWEGLKESLTVFKSDGAYAQALDCYLVDLTSLDALWFSSQFSQLFLVSPEYPASIASHLPSHIRRFGIKYRLDLGKAMSLTRILRVDRAS